MTEGPEPSRPPESPPGRRPSPSAEVPATLVPESGWHVLHLYYRIDRATLAGMSEADRRRGREELRAALDPTPDRRQEQFQTFAVPGHKADFGLVMAGPDLRALHDLQTSVEASALGPCLVPTFSFYSITEVSEYVPTAEDYGRILREREGIDPDSPTYRAKVEAYASRQEPMNRQRLYPVFPDWPCLCFYPMSKLRVGEQNWYLLPFEDRAELMGQHGRSGMKFAGRVTQLITASTGLDDWEWGVTLWARNPSYLKDIVYTMRFDESSAMYAQFGPFFFGFLLPPDGLLDALRLGGR
jgi:chlorite dismutase